MYLRHTYFAQPTNDLSVDVHMCHFHACACATYTEYCVHRFQAELKAQWDIVKYLNHKAAKPRTLSHLWATFYSGWNGQESNHELLTVVRIINIVVIVLLYMCWKELYG